MNDVLFIGGTHGDEKNGVEILKRLSERRSDFDWIVGNPKALEQGTREYEGNLNRCAPGDPSAPNYASRRAAEIVELSKKYKYVIDLHGSPKNVGNFIILTKLTVDNLRLATMLNIKNIVYWPAFSPELSGPLSEFFTCGLEIESGPKDDPRVADELEKILDEFLNEKNTLTNIDVHSALVDRRVFEVYGSLKDEVGVRLEEFTETEIDGERFFPLLVSSYFERVGVVCYKMRKINNILDRVDLEK